jgi:hypothetical protein
LEWWKNAKEKARAKIRPNIHLQSDRVGFSRLIGTGGIPKVILTRHPSAEMERWAFLATHKVSEITPNENITSCRA